MKEEYNSVDPNEKRLKYLCLTATSVQEELSLGYIHEIVSEGGTLLYQVGNKIIGASQFGRSDEEEKSKEKGS